MIKRNNKKKTRVDVLLRFSYKANDENLISNIIEILKVNFKYIQFSSLKFYVDRYSYTCSREFFYLILVYSTEHK